MLLALDPGANSPGVALFDNGRLLAADRVSGSAYKDWEDGQRWLGVARSIVDFVQIASPQWPVTGVVFERPQWYAKAKSKGDPNQLAGIAGVAANVTGILSCYFRSLVVQSPTPAEWIGQLPKTCPACHANKKKCPECRGSAWNTPRGRRIRSRLTPAELALVPDQNDAIDACGLGLFKLGRLTPRSTLSNGRDGR